PSEEIARVKNIITKHANNRREKCDFQRPHDPAFAASHAPFRQTAQPDRARTRYRPTATDSGDRVPHPPPWEALSLALRHRAAGKAHDAGRPAGSRISEGKIRCGTA